ncbi:hypothetical protein BDW69DRAFT_175211 [Aspergillus filifer]
MNALALMYTFPTIPTALMSWFLPSLRIYPIRFMSQPPIALVLGNSSTRTRT